MKRTGIPIGRRRLRRWGAAGLSLAMICLAPIVVFYVFAAKSLIAGLTAGAVKG